MLGLSPRCYIPSFVEIGPPVLGQKTKGFYHILGVMAIMVMLPRCREQTFVSPTQGGSTSNLALIGQAALEKKMFIIVDVRTYVRRTDAGAGYPISSSMSLRLR